MSIKFYIFHFDCKKSDFCFVYTRKTGTDEGKYGFYRVIRSQIFRVLVTLSGKMASLSYNKVVYRFTRALFGLTCSPFLLNGVLSVHLKSWETKRPKLVEEIRKNLYVDDLMTGGATIAEVKEKKSRASEIFEDATFKLPKWHSNVKERESPSHNDQEEVTFAKQELGDSTPRAKLLGLPWDKSKAREKKIHSKKRVFAVFAPTARVEAAFQLRVRART